MPLPGAAPSARADALEVLNHKRPLEAATIVADLERQGGPTASCLREAQDAAVLLDAEHFADAESADCLRTVCGQSTDNRPQSIRWRSADDKTKKRPA